MFVYDQAGSLKIRCNLVLYARLNSSTFFTQIEEKHVQGDKTKKKKKKEKKKKKKRKEGKKEVIVDFGTVSI